MFQMNAGTGAIFHFFCSVWKLEEYAILCKLTCMRIFEVWITGLVTSSRPTAASQWSMVQDAGICPAESGCQAPPTAAADFSQFHKIFGTKKPPNSILVVRKIMSFENF